nr:hypothetical protein LVJ77_03685 [Conchiformibius kuhniae]
MKGKWMMCQDGIAIRQKISRNSRDTVTLKFTHAEQYEQSDCTGAVKQSIGTKEFLEKMGLQKGNFNYKLKINDLKNKGNAFTAPVTVFSSVQAKMKTEDKNLNIEGEGTSEGVLHIQADGSEFEMEMGNSRMKLIRAK